MSSDLCWKFFLAAVLYCFDKPGVRQLCSMRHRTVVT